MSKIFHNMWVMSKRMIFWISCILMLPGILFFHPLIRAPITIGIVVILMPHILKMSISQYSYLELPSVVFREVFFLSGNRYVDKQANSHFIILHYSIKSNDRGSLQIFSTFFSILSNPNTVIVWTGTIYSLNLQFFYSHLYRL